VQPSNSLLALLLADQQERWQRGERPFVESYFDRWPAVRADQETTLDLIYHEFLLREEHGEAPDPAEYQDRFPQCRDALRLLFEVHRAMPRGESGAGAGPPRCVLSIVRGPHRGEQVDLDGYRTLLVGRGSQARLRLPDDAHASRHHFLLEVNPPRGYVRDLGSHNGTFVNGERVREQYLRDGDVITAGQSYIRFGVEGRPEAGPSRAAVAGPPAVPGYEVLHPLGPGGRETVYLARRQATGEQVALRVIVPDPATSEAALRQCLGELTGLTQLDHPRVVRCHELGLADGQVFAVTEHVPAVPPGDALAGRSEEERIRTYCDLLCQALEGLAHAHARNVFHRDVRPANLLVSREGGGLAAKLAGFGLVGALTAAGMLGLTHAQPTPDRYALQAPEQLLDPGQATPAADVYAAGASLYYLIANASPHDFAGRLDPLLVVLETPPVPLRGRCPAVPRPLAEVVERALARDPGQRFATAEAMRQALLPHAARPAV
jgi:serine/threonine-protein kinase